MARVNEQRVKALAEIVTGIEPVSVLNFYSYGSGDRLVVASDEYPALDQPRAVEFFFLVCQQNFGFWHGDAAGYRAPLVAKLGGQERKGSELLWRTLKRHFDHDPAWFNPERLAALADDELATQVFVGDDGPIPFPELEKRTELARAYGRRLRDQGLTPTGLVRKANAAERPLAAFLEALRNVPGFAEDQLQKKALLLAMALANRPERFLEVRDPESWKPVVDYHLMRVALRTGLVLLDDAEVDANVARAWVPPEVEDEIRRATYEAVQGVIEASGRPMALVDLAFWSARRYCPETSRPNCAKCRFQPACQRRIELFQPVRRTTNY